MTPFLTKRVLQVVDNFTKYSCLHLLYSKEKNQVIPALTEQLYFFEVPTILHSDNGGGGIQKQKTCPNFARKTTSEQVHGAPRNPSTQGLE